MDLNSYNISTGLHGILTLYHKKFYRNLILNEEKRKLTDETALHFFSGEPFIQRDELIPPYGIEYTKFSKLQTLYNVTAWCIRFLQNVKRKVEYKRGNINSTISSSTSSVLTSIELDQAQVLWTKFIQRKHFLPVLKYLQSSEHKTQKVPDLIHTLNLNLDKDGQLRCYGVFTYSDLDYNVKYPKLLPTKDYYTHLIIMYCHEKVFHFKTSSTLNRIRKEYWIPKGRRMVQNVIKQCKICQRYDNGPYVYPSAPPYPTKRITESKPFGSIGLDYFGPFNVKQLNPQLTDSNPKTWICIFTCLNTRAISLELITDMTSYQFLLAFKRFISRFGSPTYITSDIALTFKLSSNCLNEIYKPLPYLPRSDIFLNYISNERITWNFIPELSPWMGGHYERLIGICKKAIKKTVGRNLFNSYSITNVNQGNRSIVNSRPLTYVSSELSEKYTLSPSDLLTPNTKTGIPQLDTDSLQDKNFEPKPIKRT